MSRLDAVSSEKDQLAGRLEESLLANRDQADRLDRASREARELAESSERKAGELAVQIRSLEDELASVRSAAEAARLAYEKGLDEVRGELRSAIERADQLEHEAGTSAEAVAREQAELATARQLAASLESKLAETQQAQTKTHDELRRMGIHFRRPGFY